MPQLVNILPHGQASFHRADAPFLETFLLATRGAEPDSITPCGPGDTLLGVVEDKSPPGGELYYPLHVSLLGASPGTRRAIASGAIDVDALLTPDVGGKVRAVTDADNGVWVVGKAFGPASADGDQIHFIGCFPWQLPTPAPSGGSGGAEG